jgi:hypothetical protein
MKEPSTFELGLGALLREYAEQAPIVVDAAALAREVVGNRRDGRFVWPFANQRWLVFASVLLLLLLTLIASLYVGSRLVEHRSRPAGALLVTDGAALECQGLKRVDLATGSIESLIGCADRLLVAPDGLRAVARSPEGLELIDLSDMSTRIVPGTEGTVATPVAWSPRGTYLYWVADDTVTGQQDFAYIGTLDDIHHSELAPQPLTGGYLCCASWSADESATLLLDGYERAIGAGDGSGASSIGALDVLALSPDGSQIAYRAASILDTNSTADVWIRDASGQTTNLTNFPEPARAAAAAWSTDGRIAVVSATRPTASVPDAPTSDDLWIYGPDGSKRHLTLTFEAGPAGDATLLEWSPDGTHLLLALQDTNPPLDPPTPNAAGIFIVSVADGTMTPIHGWEKGGVPTPIFSPDGHMVASMTGPNFESGLHIFTLDGRPAVAVDGIVPGPSTAMVWLH